MVTKDIAELLVLQFGYVIGGNLFIAREPTDPEDIVTIFDIPSPAPMLTFDNVTYEYKGFNLRVRNSNYITCVQTAQDIKEYLHGITFETSTHIYTLVKATDEPFLFDFYSNVARVITNYGTQRKPK